MDKEEIQLRLAGYRPELYADDDPLIAEALAAAKADPQLSAWLEEQIAFDRDLSASLCELEPLSNSRDQLLAEASATPASKPRFALWQFAAAALFLICSFASVKYFLFPAPIEFARTETKTISQLREDMAMFASKRFILDETFTKLEDSQRWLEEQEHPTFDEVPGQLVQYRGLGCKTIDWSGTKVGLICFENSKEQTVHLFVIDAADFANLSPADSPLHQVVNHHQLETAGWIADGKVLLLVGSGPKVHIGELL